MHAKALVQRAYDRAHEGKVDNTERGCAEADGLVRSICSMSSTGRSLHPPWLRRRYRRGGNCQVRRVSA
jgi:hypothetical protein